MQGPKPRCILKQNSSLCGHPEPVENGYYSIGSSDTNGGDNMYLEGTKVVYTCDGGYTLYGNPSRTCISSLWAGDLPSCVPGCSDPPTIPHGDYNFFGQNNMIASGRSSEGTKAYYFCDNGYRMKDKNMSSLRCQQGLWSGTMPVCSK